MKELALLLECFLPIACVGKLEQVVGTDELAQRCSEVFAGAANPVHLESVHGIDVSERKYSRRTQSYGYVNPFDTKVKWA